MHWSLVLISLCCLSVGLLLVDVAALLEVDSHNGPAQLSTECSALVRSRIMLAAHTRWYRFDVSCSLRLRTRTRYRYWPMHQHSSAIRLSGGEYRMWICCGRAAWSLILESELWRIHLGNSSFRALLLLPRPAAVGSCNLLACALMSTRGSRLDTLRRRSHRHGAHHTSLCLSLALFCCLSPWSLPLTLSLSLSLSVSLRSVYLAERSKVRLGLSHGWNAGAPLVRAQ